MFRRWKWRKFELGKPVSFVISVHYKKLDEIREKYGLETLGLEACCKNKVKKEIGKQTIVSNIRGLRSFEAARVWSAVEIERVSNRQRDVTWLALHEGLLTKVFLKGRDIIQSERCPREVCGGNEDVKHVLWECDYAQKDYVLMSFWTKYVSVN